MTQPPAPPTHGVPWPPPPVPPAKRPAWQWVVPLIAVVVLVPLALAAWAFFGIRDEVTTSPQESASQSAATSAQTAASEAAVAAVQGAVAELPGVASVDLQYVQSLDVDGAVIARLTVATAGDVEVVRDELVQQLWLSEVDPLRYVNLTMTVSGASSGDQPATENIRFTGRDGDELEQQYGPRPK